MTQFVTVDRATLEQIVGALEKHHKQETRYSDNKRRANATCAHFTVNPLQELAEQAYMLTHGKETIEAIAAGRAALANAERVESKPTFTTGHCKEKQKPGGCQLHNLQCGYPKCDMWSTIDLGRYTGTYGGYITKDKL